MAKFKTELNLLRAHDEMRTPEVTLAFTPNALASVLYKQGAPVVLACCTKEARLPGWFPRDATKGWVHAEYSLLPGSTDSRFRRERRGAKGRTQEIERLIARSLRAAVNLEAWGPIALNGDCDVLNADGGTRCASITAANIAVSLSHLKALRTAFDNGDVVALILEDDISFLGIGGLLYTVAFMVFHVGAYGAGTALHAARPFRPTALRSIAT